MESSSGRKSDEEFAGGYLGKGTADGCGGIVRQFGALTDGNHERGRVREWLPDTPAALYGEQS